MFPLLLHPPSIFRGEGFLKEIKHSAGWVIEKDSHKVFFSGDTGYDTHFKAIGEKLWPFDLAFLDSGQYNVLWKEVHLLPKEVPLVFGPQGAT